MVIVLAYAQNGLLLSQDELHLDDLDAWLDELENDPMVCEIHTESI